MNRMTLTLAKSVFTEFRRDFVSALFTLALPLFFLLTFGMQSGLRADISLKVAVLDQAQSDTSAALVRSLTNQEGLSLLFLDEAEAQKRLNNSTLHAILQLKAEPATTGGVQLTLTQRGQANPFINRAVEAAVYQLYPGEQASNLLGAMSHQVLENRKSSTFSYFMPALLGMALLQLALFGTAVPLMTARARGSLLHLSMTPVPVSAIVAAHVLVRLAIAAVQLLLLLAIAVWGYGLVIQGNPLLLFLSCLLGALMLIATGFLLGGIAPSQQAGNYLVMLVNFPMLFLGNIFFDTSSFGALDWVARALPITYLSDLNRQLILGNEGRFSAMVDWLVLAVSAAVLIFFAIKSFRFSMESRV